MHSELYIDGVWYPSVTTITAIKPSPWLDAWKAKWGVLAERKMKIASAIGTEFHRCVEQWLDTGTYSVMSPRVEIRQPTTIGYMELPSTMSRVEGMMKSWVNWAATIDGEISDTELQVVSRTHTYSGTLDAVGTLAGKPMLFDWKTSSRIYPDMDLQLVAYAQAYKEQTGVELKRGIIVHVGKDKPHFRVTTKEFKLGKRVFNKFLKLRREFDIASTGSYS